MTVETSSSYQGLDQRACSILILEKADPLDILWDLLDEGSERLPAQDKATQRNGHPYEVWQLSIWPDSVKQYK
jgi:hypothetical protein